MEHDSESSPFRLLFTELWRHLIRCEIFVLNYFDSFTEYQKTVIQDRFSWRDFIALMNRAYIIVWTAQVIRLVNFGQSFITFYLRSGLGSPLDVSVFVLCYSVRATKCRSQKSGSWHNLLILVTWSSAAIYLAKCTDWSLIQVTSRTVICDIAHFLHPLECSANIPIYIMTFIYC